MYEKLNNYMRFKLIIAVVILNVFTVNGFCQIDGKSTDFLKRILKNDFALVLKKTDSENCEIALNADKMMIPASIVKLLTTGAALKELSPKYRFKTNVYTLGSIRNRTLYGDLLISGGGDPTVESHYFEDRKYLFITTIADALKKNGIDTIIGNIIVDASRYGINGISEDWGVDDIGNYYGTGVYGFNIFDNYFDLYAKIMNEKVVLLNDKDYDWITFQNFLIPNNKNTNTDIAFSTPMSDEITVEGAIGKADTVNLRPAVPNPAKFASRYIKKELSKYISISGIGLYNYGKMDYKVSCKRKICEYYSPTLKDIVSITNHVSHNMFAEVLSREMDVFKSGNTTIDYKTPEYLLSFWRMKIKSDIKNLILNDASGLSRKDRLTANVMCRSLDFLINDKDIGGVFVESLPVAGMKGERFNSVRKLRTASSYTARIKSGSMKGVKSYAGIIEHKKDRYIIVFIYNGVSGAVASDAFVKFLNKTFK